MLRIKSIGAFRRHRQIPFHYCSQHQVAVLTTTADGATSTVAGIRNALLRSSKNKDVFVTGTMVRSEKQPTKYYQQQQKRLMQQEQQHREKQQLLQTRIRGEDIIPLFNALRAFASVLPSTLVQQQGATRAVAAVSSSLPYYFNDNHDSCSYYNSNDQYSSNPLSFEQVKEEYNNNNNGFVTSSSSIFLQEEQDISKPIPKQKVASLETQGQQQLQQKDMTTNAPNILNNNTNHNQPKSTVKNNKFENPILKCIYSNNPKKAIELFEISQKTYQHEFSLYTIRKLVLFFSDHGYPFHAYQLLVHYKNRIHYDHYSNKKQQQEETYEEQPTETKTYKDITTTTTENFYDETKSNNILLSLYSSVSNSIKFASPVNSRYRDLKNLVRDIQNDLKFKIKNDHIRKKCLPILLSSLVQQRSTSLGLWGRNLYDFIKTEFNVDDILPMENSENSEDMVFSYKYLEHLLSLSRYNRQQDLPYSELFHKVIIEGNRKPSPAIVMNALENFYPYTNNNCNDAVIALKCIIHLQQEKNQQTQRQRQRQRQQQQQSKSYIIDIATLECISTAAASNGNLELMLLIWDYMDVMKSAVPNEGGDYASAAYEPATEAIYENTVLTFAKSSQNQNIELQENALVVMLDMEEKGYIPSRPLIRMFSRILKNNSTLLEDISCIIDALTMKCNKLSVSTLNVLLSAIAERGYYKWCMLLFEEYFATTPTANSATTIDTIAPKPNADTFSFLLEGLHKNYLFKKRVTHENYQSRLRNINYNNESAQEQEEVETNKYNQLLDQCSLEHLEHANSILLMIEENNIIPTSHIIRNYIDLLCSTGNYETATLVVMDALERKTASTGKDDVNHSNNDINVDEERVINVDNQTIYLIAMFNAEQLHDFEIAKKLASKTSEPLPFLDNKIRELEISFAQNSNSSSRTLSEATLDTPRPAATTTV